MNHELTYLKNLICCVTLTSNVAKWVAAEVPSTAINKEHNYGGDAPTDAPYVFGSI